MDATRTGLVTLLFPLAGGRELAESLAHVQFGLEVDAPREFRPAAPDSKLAGALGALLQTVGYAQVIEPSLDAEVASARGSADREVSLIG